MSFIDFIAHLGFRFFLLRFIEIFDTKAKQHNAHSDQCAGFIGGVLLNKQHDRCRQAKNKADFSEVSISGLLMILMYDRNTPLEKTTI
jgi:hypothetical protein